MIVILIIYVEIIDVFYYDMCEKENKVNEDFKQILVWIFFVKDIEGSGVGDNVFGVFDYWL